MLGSVLTVESCHRRNGAKGRKSPRIHRTKHSTQRYLPLRNRLCAATHGSPAILLLDTKSKLALPGRTYDLLGPAWQQEHWGMARNRGLGTHRSWLPWVSVNHLHSITSLEEFDPALYRRQASRK